MEYLPWRLIVINNKDLFLYSMSSSSKNYSASFVFFVLVLIKPVLYCEDEYIKKIKYKKRSFQNKLEQNLIVSYHLCLINYFLARLKSLNLVV